MTVAISVLAPVHDYAKSPRRNLILEVLSKIHEEALDAVGNAASSETSLHDTVSCIWF